MAQQRFLPGDREAVPPVFQVLRFVDDQYARVFLHEGLGFIFVDGCVIAVDPLQMFQAVEVFQVAYLGRIDIEYP